MVFASLFNELCDLFSGCVRREKMSSMNRFQTGGLKDYKKG